MIDANNDANVSTDLGVAYYYVDQPDKAIAQFEQSLKIDPKHTKTMLNMGIVKAFGKQEMAADAWARGVRPAPGTILGGPVADRPASAD